MGQQSGIKAPYVRGCLPLAACAVPDSPADRRPCQGQLSSLTRVVEPLPTRREMWITAPAAAGFWWLLTTALAADRCLLQMSGAGGQC